MKHRFSLLLGIVMTVVLAVTGLSAAYARGQADPTGTMVICRGLTVVTVLVGSDGQPVEMTHLCPDAAQALFVEQGAAPDAIARPLVWRAVDWTVPDLLPGLVILVSAQARAPPVFSDSAY